MARGEFVRPASAVIVLFLTGLALWETRGEWRVALPSLLFLAVMGWSGGEMYRLVVRRQGGNSGIVDWFVAAGLTSALVAVSAALASGGWRGWHTLLGATGWAASIALWLVFLRLAIYGTPRPSPGAEDV